MPRQVISAFRVMPPFEIVDYPKTIDIKVKTPLGQEISITVPVTLFDNEEDYMADAHDTITKVRDAQVMERASEVRLVTPEQLDALKTGKIKVDELDKIEEESLDLFSVKMSAKTLDTAE